MFICIIPIASVAALSFAALGGFGLDRQNAFVILFTGDYAFIVDVAAVWASRFAVHAAVLLFFCWGGGSFGVTGVFFPVVVFEFAGTGPARR